MSHISSFCLTVCMSFVLVGCSNRESADTGLSPIRINPSIQTRVSGLYFEPGDCIGLSVAGTTLKPVENLSLTYRNAYFADESLTWNDIGSGPLTFTAYYPYAEAGLSAGFAVATDQRGGCGPSDLLGAVKTDVAPTSEPIHMLFQHLMSQLNIVVNNDSSSSVTKVTVSGFVSEAEVDLVSMSAEASPSAAASDITAYEETAGELYRVILVPQRAPLTVRVETTDGMTRSTTVSDAALEGGRRYNLSIALTDQTLDMALSGEIGDWVDGGTLVPDDPDGEKPGGGGGDDSEGGDETPDGDLVYEGETYATAEIGGATWMAENFRYLPDASMIGTLVWYPEGGMAQVAELGLFYSYEAVMNGASAQASLPVRGICPPGWHIPSRVELEALAEAASADFITDAGYYNGSSYIASGTSILIGCEASGDGACWVLKKKLNELSVATVSFDYGVSLRCVKN